MLSEHFYIRTLLQMCSTPTDVSRLRAHVDSIHAVHEVRVVVSGEDIGTLCQVWT